MGMDVPTLSDAIRMAASVPRWGTSPTPQFYNRGFFHWSPGRVFRVCLEVAFGPPGFLFFPRSPVNYHRNLMLSSDHQSWNKPDLNQ